MLGEDVVRSLGSAELGKWRERGKIEMKGKRRKRGGQADGCWVNCALIFLLDEFGRVWKHLGEHITKQYHQMNNSL